jgi:tetratricopeptide (TPR) repeat protein
MSRKSDKGPLTPIDTIPDAASELADPTARTRLPEQQPDLTDEHEAPPEDADAAGTVADYRLADEEPDSGLDAGATVADYRLEEQDLEVGDQDTVADYRLEDAASTPEVESFDAAALLPQETEAQETTDPDPGGSDAYADETVALTPSLEPAGIAEPTAVSDDVDRVVARVEASKPGAQPMRSSDWTYGDDPDLLDGDAPGGPLHDGGTQSLEVDQILEIASDDEALRVDPEQEVDTARALDVTVNDARPQDPAPDGISWEGRFARLEQELGETDLSPRRVEILVEMGAIADDRLDDRAVAVECFERGLKLDPGNARAFEQLDRLYQLDRNLEQRIELLINRTEHVKAPAEQARLLQSVSRLYLQQEEEDKAVIALEAAVNADPDNAEIVGELERLTAPPEPEDPLVRLEAQLEEATTDSKRIEVLEKMAALWLQRTAPDRTVECLEQVLVLDPRRDACYRKLEQIHKQASAFDRLADVLRRHIPVAPPEGRLELGQVLARLYEGPLAAPQRAAETYRGMLSVDPGHAPTLQALARLNEQLGDWTEAARSTRDLAEAATSDAARVELLYKLSCIQEEQLGDQQAAEETLHEVVQLAPAHTKAVARLAETYRGRGDWGKVAKLMLEAEAASPSPLEKARWLHEAGMATLEGLDDEDTAMRLFERTLEVDPDHAGAALPLSTIYFRRGAHDRLAPVLDLLLRKADPSDPARLLELSYMAAATAEALDDAKRALKFYRRANEIDQGHLPTISGLARLAFESEDWRGARRWYGQLLASGQNLDHDERVEASHRLAESALRGGDRELAARAFQQVLSLEPGHRPSLETLSELHSQGADWPAVLETKLALVEAIDDEERQVELQREIGEVYWRRLGRPDEAERSFLRALELAPDNHAVLHDLIELFSERGRWAQMIEMCRRMAEIESNPQHRAKYFFTAAVVCRDKLDRPDDAVEFFNRVLNEDAEQLKAFEAIDELCTQQRNWKQLQENYVRMIQRLPKEGAPELKVMLWHNLGEVLRSRRRDFESAITAFEAAARLEPDNVQRRKILAELYLSSGEQYIDQGIAAYHDLLRRSPRQVEIYRTLRRTYMEAGRYDQAWCICSALSLMQKADDEEMSFFQQYRRTRVIQAGAPMTDEIWRKLIHHEDQDQYINTIFALVAPVIASMTVRPTTHYKLKEKARCDPAKPSDPVVQLFYYATRVLNVTTAALYLDPQHPGALLMAHTPDVPSFVAGAALLSGRQEKEQAYIVAKQLSYLRPEHFLRNALPTKAQLQAVLLAVLKLFSPELSLPADQDKAVKPVVEALNQQLSVGQKEQLAHLVRRITPKQIAAIDRWWRCLDLVSDRVGLLVSNDLEISAGMINADPSSSEIPAGERVNQLVAYACSEAYFTARAKLRLTIDQGA